MCVCLLSYEAKCGLGGVFLCGVFELVVFRGWWAGVGEGGGVGGGGGWKRGVGRGGGGVVGWGGGLGGGGHRDIDLRKRDSWERQAGWGNPHREGLTQTWRETEEGQRVERRGRGRREEGVGRIKGLGQKRGQSGQEEGNLNRTFFVDTINHALSILGNT